MTECPNCGSTKVRRGGSKTWLVYVVLIVLAVPAVLQFHLNAAIVAAIMLAIIVLVNLVWNERVCTNCGHQW
ncbi:MAG TPA: hypothetical protein VFN10_05515 [Thermoanaerobaculia bacterium]|nr:hypothetical protein [Thermoanaerobaculia bacterium]